MKKICLLLFVLLTVLKLYSQEGTLDLTFGNAGFVKLGISYDASAFQSDGKRIGVQKITGGFSVSRYNTDGTIDKTFGNGGTVSTVIPYLTTPTTVLISVQPGNDNVVVWVQGASNSPGSYRTFGIARFTPNGILDQAFGSGGIVATNFFDSNMSPSIGFLVVGKDGNIATATRYSAFRQTYAVIDSYDYSGSIKWSRRLQPQLETNITALAVGDNGEVAAGLFSEERNPPRRPEVTITTISTNGTAITFGGIDFLDYVVYSALAVQPDGKVLGVLGTNIYRFTTARRYDSTFGSNGSTNVGFTINSIAVQQNGRILAGGAFSGNFALARFNSDGTISYTFGNNGKTITDFGGIESIEELGVTSTRLYAYGSGILAAYKFLPSCTPPTFAPNSSIVNASCGNSDGSISIVPTSGVPPFQYSLNAGGTYVPGSDTGVTFTNLTAAVYRLRIKDGSGCESDVVDRIVASGCLPSITNFTPAFGAAGSSVTIAGTNFSPNAADNIVYFGAVKATVTTASATSLTVIVPAGATFSPISVTANNLTAYSSRSFILTFSGSSQGFSSGSFAPKIDFPTAISPNILAVKDLDNDGRPDMVVATNYYNNPPGNSFKVSLFRNISSPGIMDFERIDLPLPIIASFDIADLNGDGKLDLVAAIDGAVYILRNTSSAGTVSFTQTSFVSTAAVRSRLAISDVDGDGKPDLVLPRFIGGLNEGPRFAVLKNLSTPQSISFASAIAFGYAAGFTFDDITMADLDGDKRPDYVYPTYRNTSVGGIFAFEPQPSVGGPVSAIGDLDGDGKTDLVASPILIRRNISIPGTITFVNSLVAIGSNPSIGDLDGDGKPDIVGDTSNSLFVYKNLSTTGNILLAPPVNYPAGSGGPSAIADFDGDGVSDIAVVNTLSNTVSVFRNLSGQVAGCTPPTFLNNNQIVLDATCGKNDGNIYLIPTSGTAPFMYSKDSGATYVAGANAGFTFNNLAAGTYNLRLKDANGCESAIVSKEVKAVYGCPVTCVAPTFLNSNAVVLDASCGKSDGTITIVPTSGTAPFMYSKDSGTTYVTGSNSGFTFSSLAGGTYRLRLKDATGCESAVVEKTVRNIYNCPGITYLFNSPVISQPSLTVSPNPTKGLFKVQLPNIISGKAELSVFDAKGIVVQKRQVVLSKNNTIDFDLTGRSPGLYYIKMVTGSGTMVAKVIKQ